MTSHSSPSHASMPKLLITQLPAGQDNYVYILREEGSDNCVVIDPTEAPPVLGYLRKNGLKVGAIWNTHHHHDHVGGNLEIAGVFHCEVLTSARDFARIPGATRALENHEVIRLGSRRFEVLHTPGHTEGHLCFYCVQEASVFCGDLVFPCGCGRIFEGTMEQLYGSIQVVKALPPGTLIYAAHEYGMSNTHFARDLVAQAQAEAHSAAPSAAGHLVPFREQILQRLVATIEKKKAAQPTTPSLVDEEKATNPFFIAPTLGDFSVYREFRNSYQFKT